MTSPTPSGEKSWVHFLRSRLWLQTVVILALIGIGGLMFWWLVDGIKTGELSASVAALAGGLVGAITMMLGQAGKDFFNPED